MGRERQSFDSIREATEDKTVFSGHGAAKGVAGFHDSGNIIAGNPDFLSESGQMKTFAIPEGQFQSLNVTLSWNNIVPHPGFMARILGKKTGIDLDLGCLYELADGKRGSVQAFGGLLGALDQPPYIKHSGDERTGDKPGVDESLHIEGAKWENIKRFLIYAYVYAGPTNWRAIKPEVRVAIPGQTPMVVTLAAGRSDLPVCALATVDNVNNGVKLTNHSEYFSSHSAMDRAFGYGLRWEDGHK